MGVHGSEDDNVALSAAHKLYRKAAALKTLCVVEGADHNLRDAAWRDLVAHVCTDWLATVALPRGASSTSRARAVLQAQHAGAAALCNAAMLNPAVLLAIDPAPQRPNGGTFPFRAYEVPPIVPESYANGHDANAFACQNARLVKRCASHGERLRKARERRNKEMQGSFKEAYEKLQASRQRRQYGERTCSFSQQGVDLSASLEEGNADSDNSQNSEANMV